MTFVTENPVYEGGTKRRKACPFPHFDQFHQPKIGPAAFVYVLRETASFADPGTRVVACRQHMPRWAKKEFEEHPQIVRPKMTYEDKPSRQNQNASSQQSTISAFTSETGTDMPLFTVQAGSDIPDGVYQVILADVTGPKTIIPKSGPQAGQNVQIFEWKFVVSDGEYEDTVIDENTSASTGPRSKMYGWLSALFGKAPEINQSFEAEDLKGRVALATVARGENGWPKIVNLSALPASMLAKGVAQATGAPVKGGQAAPSQAPSGAASTLREQAQSADLPF